MAKEALRGRWFVAVVVGWIAALLGGIASERPELKFHFDRSGLQLSVEYAGRTLFSTGGGVLPEARSFLFEGVSFPVLVVLVGALLYFIIGSGVSIGYAWFHLKLASFGNPEFGDLFSYMFLWRTAAAMRIRRAIYVALWSCLLIIPGIMAAYSYSMTEYILAQNPNLTAREAMRRSKEMMRGYRLHLFFLQLSFIGWQILCAFTLGIGNLWLLPYQQTATAVFYREISGSAS